MIIKYKEIERGSALKASFNEPEKVSQSVSFRRYSLLIMKSLDFINPTTQTFLPLVLSAGFKIWKEQTRFSSTLIKAAKQNFIYYFLTTKLTRVVKLTAIVWSWEHSNQLSFSKELISIFDDLGVSLVIIIFFYRYLMSSANQIEFVFL